MAADLKILGTLGNLQVPGKVREFGVWSREFIFCPNFTHESGFWSNFMCLRFSLDSQSSSAYPITKKFRDKKDVTIYDIKEEVVMEKVVVC